MIRKHKRLAISAGLSFVAILGLLMISTNQSGGDRVDMPAQIQQRIAEVSFVTNGFSNTGNQEPLAYQPIKAH